MTKEIQHGYGPSVPNAVPSIHGVSTGKRYCDHCGQRMLENELHTHPQDMYKGEMKLPRLRSRSNLETVYVSEGVVSKQIVITAVGNVNPTTPIVRDRDIEIGQLPKGSTRAHVNIRDVFIAISPVGSVVTGANITAFLHYKDVGGKRHCLAVIDATTLVANAVQVNANFTLVVDSVITDGAPVDLGTFEAEVLSLSLGTVTNITLDIRANIGILFEV